MTLNIFFQFSSFVSGFKRAYAGVDMYWNILDTFIVVMAWFDIVLAEFIKNASEPASGSAFESGSFGPQSLTIMRILRLVRITRLVRLLRFNMFKELTLMVKGVVAGLRTLFWAFMLLVIVVFIIGVSLRQLIGRDKHALPTQDPLSGGTANLAGQAAGCYVQAYGSEALEPYRAALFDTLGNSMLTVFRCLVGECASVDGTPLVVHMMDHYGFIFISIYFTCFVFVVFGIFNLIMALYIENTTEAAKINEKKRDKSRRQEHIRVAQMLKRLVIKFCEAEKESDSSSTLTASEGLASLGLLRSITHRVGVRSKQLARFFAEALGTAKPQVSISRSTSMTGTQITRAVFAQVIQDQEVDEVLENLQIAIADKEDLFDVLDADGSGSLDPAEIISGIMKLRGSAEKSDVIACLLNVRHVMSTLQEFVETCQENHTSLLNGQKELLSRIAATTVLARPEAC